MATQSVKRKLTPVPFTNLAFDDPFWAPRMEINRTVTIPHMYQKLEETGRNAAWKSLVIPTPPNGSKPLRIP